MSESERYNFLEKYPQLKDLEGKAFLNAKDFKSCKDDKERYQKIKKDKGIQGYIDSIYVEHEEFSDMLKKPKSKYGICVGEQHGGDKSHILEMIPYLARKGIPFFTEGLGKFELDQKDVDEYLYGKKGEEWIEEMRNIMKKELISDPIYLSANLWELKFLQECKKYGCKFYLTSTYVSYSNADEVSEEKGKEINKALTKRMALYNKPTADIIKKLAPKDKHRNLKFFLNTGSMHTYHRYNFDNKKIIPGIPSALCANRIGFQENIMDDLSTTMFKMIRPIQKGNDFYAGPEKLIMPTVIDQADFYLNAYQDPRKWKTNKMLQVAFYTHDFKRKGEEIWIDDTKKITIKNDKIQTEKDLQNTLSKIITQTCKKMNITTNELLTIANKAWIYKGVGSSEKYKKDLNYQRDKKISAFFQKCCKENGLYSPINNGKTALQLKYLLRLYSQEEISSFSVQSKISNKNINTKDPISLTQKQTIDL